MPRSGGNAAPAAPAAVAAAAAAAAGPAAAAAAATAAEDEEEDAPRARAEAKAWRTRSETVGSEVRAEEGMRNIWQATQADKQTGRQAGEKSKHGG